MQTVLITGATSGFGLATAKLLAKDGYKLILLGRRQERLDELKKLLKTEMLTAAIDVTNKQQVADFFDSLPEDFRQIDILVNSAGLALGMGPVQDSRLEDWERMVDTNIQGLLRITHPVLRIMAGRGSGLIINMGSVAATMAYKGGHVYGGTKAFVRQFSRNLRIDLFGTGVKVTNIEPGAAETEFSVVRFGNEQAAKEYYQGWHPLKAEDVAKTVQWVISRPPHVNIENIEIMPLDQAPAGAMLNRKEAQ